MTIDGLSSTVGPRALHPRIAITFAALFAPILALISLAPHTESVVHASSGQSGYAGGYVGWSDIPNPCAPDVSASGLDLSCKVVGSSTIADFRTIHVAREAGGGGSRYRVQTVLLSDEGIYLSGVEAMKTYTTTYSGLRTKLYKICETPTYKVANTMVRIWGTSAQDKLPIDVGIIGVVDHDSACAIQGNCASEKKVWTCGATTDTGSSLKGRRIRSYAEAPVPDSIDAILTFHGVETVDNDSRISTTDVPSDPEELKALGTLTGIDVHFRDNLYYAFSESQPLFGCEPGGCKGVSGAGWEDEYDRVRLWPYASPSSSGGGGSPQLSNFSGGSGPSWNICYKYAVGTTCFCDELDADGFDLNLGFLSVDGYPDEGWGTLWDQFDTIPPLAAGPGQRTPFEYSLRALFTEEVLEPDWRVPDGWVDPASIRYNCHGLTFDNASQSSPSWLQHAELELPPCGSGWTRLPESATKIPGDIAVYYQIGSFAFPRWSTHSATVNGTWSGGSTPMKTKNGLSPRYNDMTLGMLKNIYHTTNNKTEIIFYRPTP